MSKKARNLFLLTSALLVVLALVSSTFSQTDQFDFDAYKADLTDENQLIELALKRTADVVYIEAVTEKTARLVPLGEWMYSMGSVPSSTVGNPAQPVFVLAMRGTFRIGGWIPGKDDPTKLPSSPTFTIAIDAVTGDILSHTAQFMDPYKLVELNITFPPPITIEITAIHPERTQEMNAIPLPLDEITSPADVVPLPLVP
jgi:hypothetical protein